MRLVEREGEAAAEFATRASSIPPTTPAVAFHTDAPAGFIHIDYGVNAVFSRCAGSVGQ
jgi:hypothetical protein